MVWVQSLAQEFPHALGAAKTPTKPPKHKQEGAERSNILITLGKDKKKKCQLISSKKGLESFTDEFFHTLKRTIIFCNIETFPEHRNPWTPPQYIL